MDIPELRLIICGAGRAGKTSLARSLLGLPFDANLSSTVGMDLSRVFCIAEKNANGDMLWTWKEMDEARLRERMFISILSKHNKDISNVLPNETGWWSSIKSAVKSFIDTFRDVFDRIRGKDWNALAEEVANKNLFFITVWDFGGQEAFSVVQRILLSHRRCAFAVVFDASSELDDPVNMNYNVGGRERPMAVRSAKCRTNFEVLASWLDSLYHIVKSPEGCAVLYVIGCRIDEYRGSASARETHKRNLRAQILERIRGKPYEEMVLDVIIVDNKSGGAGHNGDVDHNIQRLRQIYINGTEGRSGMRLQIPAQWVPFMMGVCELSTKRIEPTMPLAVAKEIAKACCRISNDREVEALLSFYHDLGHILHFSKHPGVLKDSVIIDVESLVKAISALFIPPYEGSNWEANPDHLPQYRLLHNHGILLESFAELLWQEPRDHKSNTSGMSKEMRRYVFELMKAFSMLISVGRFKARLDLDSSSAELLKSAATGDVYLVPAMVDDELGGLPESMLELFGDRNQQVQLHYEIVPPVAFDVCGGHQFPPTLFWRVVVHCLGRFFDKDAVHTLLPLKRNYVELVLNDSLHLVLLRYQHGLLLAIQDSEAAMKRRSSTSRRSLRRRSTTADPRQRLRDACSNAKAVVHDSLVCLIDEDDTLKFLKERLDLSTICRCSVHENPCQPHNKSHCMSATCHHFVSLSNRRCKHPSGRKMLQPVAHARQFWGQSAGKVSGTSHKEMLFPFNLSKENATIKKIERSLDLMISRTTFWLTVGFVLDFS